MASLAKNRRVHAEHVAAETEARAVAAGVAAADTSGGPGEGGSTSAHRTPELAVAAPRSG